MKRMWHKWLALVATVTMVGAADAQNDWNQPSQIGSYQSILSRAGYGGGPSYGAPMQQPMMQPGVPMQGSPMSSAPMNSAPVNSAPMMQGGVMQSQPPMQVQGGVMQSQPMQGSMGSTNGYVGNGSMGGQYNGGMVQGGVVQSGPIVGGQPMSAPMTTAPYVGGQVGGNPTIGYDHGFVGRAANSAPSVYNGVVGGSYAQPMVSSPVYADSVCSPTVYAAAPAYATEVFQQVARPRANYVVGLSGLLFQRDYEDNRLLARNPSGDELFTNDADEQNFDGYGLNLARRNANGSGMEAVFWALNPGAVSSTLTGVDVNTTIRGFDRLIDPTSGRNLFDIYTDATSQTVIRDSNINNLEFNMLRNGGQYCLRGNRRGCYELLAGFRWFEFDEQLQYQTQTDTATYPLSSESYTYTLNARNRLLGFQLGARNELCLTDRFRLFSGVRGGLFNNNIRTRQNIVGSDGITSNVNFGPSAGRTFDYADEKNDLAFLGELDLGILMQLSCRSRLRLGYRVLGVSGVALAADQMPFVYSDAHELQRANSNGNLILGGGYYGIEFCF